LIFSIEIFVELFFDGICVIDLNLDQETLDSNPQNEWEGWVKGRDEKVQWQILGENSYEKVASSIKESGRLQGRLSYCILRGKCAKL